MSIMRENEKSRAASGSLRIGLVTPAWPGSRTANGIATAVSHLAIGLEACGHEVTIIAISVDAPYTRPRVVQLPEIHWSLLDKLRVRIDSESTAHRKYGQAIAAAVRDAIDRHGIEIVVMEETQGWAGSVARHVDIPIVVTLHGPWCLLKEFQGNSVTRADTRRDAREIKGLQWARGITAPSWDTLKRTAALRRLPSVPQTVIHNPMPIAPPIASGDTEKLLFVGRFDFLKGGDVVIEAFAEIAQRHPTCRLTFLGSDRGVERPGLPRLTMSEALARLPEPARNRIDVRGQCSREVVAALRRTHDIAIVASRFENFGGTMLEAMAVGASLVCTHVGGAEILLHEKTALLIPPGDPQAMAEACLRLLHDPALAKRLGAASRSHVEQHLSPEAIGRQIANFLAPICRK